MQNPFPDTPELPVGTLAPVGSWRYRRLSPDYFMLMQTGEGGLQRIAGSSSSEMTARFICSKLNERDGQSSIDERARAIAELIAARYEGRPYLSVEEAAVLIAAYASDTAGRQSA